jgi:hypothetical protein
MEVLQKDVDQSKNSLATEISEEDAGDSETLKLIMADRNREDYKPTKGEVFQIFTIAQEPEQLKNTILGGGFQTLFNSHTPGVQRFILGFLYAISIGVLVVYSYIIYEKSSFPYLGPTTAIAVVTTDLIVFLLIGSKLTNGPLKICLIMVSFRAFLFGFGGNKWFLGYCSLYILLQVFLSYHIVDKHFPSQNQPKEDPTINN